MGIGMNLESIGIPDAKSRLQDLIEAIESARAAHQRAYKSGIGSDGYLYENRSEHRAAFEALDKLYLNHVLIEGSKPIIPRY